MREALSRRCAVYNEQLEMVERMEEEGDILAIRPQKPVVVDRIERDIQKLTDLMRKDTNVRSGSLKPSDDRSGC